MSTKSEDSDQKTAVSKGNLTSDLRPLTSPPPAAAGPWTVIDDAGWFKLFDSAGHEITRSGSQEQIEKIAAAHNGEQKSEIRSQKSEVSSAT